jgi:hypothetical protein
MFSHLCDVLLNWSGYVLPAISNLILVMLGIVMSLPDLATTIEKSPKQKKWLGATCLVFGIIGFVFDVSQRRGSDQTNRQILGDMNTALTNTNKLVQVTTTLVTTTSATVPQLVVIHSDIADLKLQAAAAREKHDPKLVADLENRVKQKQEQADRMMQELRAITSAPQIADQLRGWELEHSFQVEMMHNRVFDENMHFGQEVERQNLSEADRAKGMKEIEQRARGEYDKIDQEYLGRLKGIIKNADSVRRELVQQIPQSSLDKMEEQQFAQALNDPMLLDRKNAAAYLEELVRRVPPPN